MRRISAPLPPLFLAYGPPAESSGTVHAPVGRRFEQGDERVLRTMAALAALADAGRAQTESGDLAGLRRAVDRNFDLRAALFELDGPTREPVRIGRELGAAVKFAGSGGAVVGIPAREADFPALARAYEAAGYSFLRPTLGPAVEQLA